MLSVATIQRSVNEFLGLYFMHIEQEKRLSAINAICKSIIYTIYKFIDSFRLFPPPLLIRLLIAVLERIIPNLNRVFDLTRLIVVLIIPRRPQTDVIVFLPQPFCCLQRSRFVRILTFQIFDAGAPHTRALLGFELRGALLGLAVHEPACDYARYRTDGDGQVRNGFRPRIHFPAGLCDLFQLAADEDV